MKSYAKMELPELIQLAKNKDEGAQRFLMRKYQSMVRTVINKTGYFLKNEPREVLVADGLVGLSRAFTDFDETKGQSESFEKKLEGFIYMCINRALISAIIKYNRQKNLPLNEMTSLDRPLQDNENLTAMDAIAASDEIIEEAGFDYYNPEEQMIFEEQTDTFENMLYEVMSPREKDVYELRKQKYSYEEIRQMLNLDKCKRVDNAMQRVRKKLLKVIEDEQRKTESF